MNPVAATIVLGLIGACLGSFAATAGLRVARGEQSLFGRSRCDGCGVALNYIQTTPVVSFLRSRGACGSCGGAIDVTHLVGEIAGVAIMLAALTASSMDRSVLIVGLGLALLATSVIDSQVRRLPDVLTLAVAVLGLALAWRRSLETFIVGIAAAAIAFLVLELIRRAFLHVRGKPGLGFGDVKLIAALALWLGVATPWAVALAALLGLIAGRVIPAKDGRIAFGPMIALAAFVVGVAREVAV